MNPMIDEKLQEIDRWSVIGRLIFIRIIITDSLKVTLGVWDDLRSISATTTFRIKMEMIALAVETFKDNL